MHHKKVTGRTAVLASLAALMVMSVVAAVLPAEDDVEGTWAKIMGPIETDNSCDACHGSEVGAWKLTHHFATFRNRHKDKRAKEIRANLGVKRMKDPAPENMCLECHYTMGTKSNKFRPRWGVSCESGHGPARDWVDVPQKVGGTAGGTALKWGDGKNEPSAQRAARLDAAAAAGMIHSEMIYEIAVNCFGCHTVPNEELVNKGKHKAGSDFDLVAWSQGEIRHNFVSSAGAPDNPTNRPATKQQLRRLYVVGAMVDLEISLRNLAAAQDMEGAYHAAMAARVGRCKDKIQQILAAVEIPELAAVMKSDDPATPDQVGAAARTFVRTHDGSTLGAIDGMIPTAYMGSAYKE